MPLSKMGFFTLNDFNLDGKTVFVRVDINSPIDPSTGKILSYQRFQSHVETLNSLRSSKVVIMAHQSRPGKEDFLSLKEHARALGGILGRPVSFVDNLFGDTVGREIEKLKDGDIIMLENTRFYSEEVNVNANDAVAAEQTNIVKSLSKYMDYFVNDAFPAIHRAQVTLTGFRRIVPNIAGRLIEKEISGIERFRKGIERPKIAILAGAKISESIAVASSFLERGMVDRILVGGVVANAFLWSSGYNIGKKNMDFIRKNNDHHTDLIDKSRAILEKYGNRIVMPTDLILNPSGRRVELTEKIPDNEIIADIGIDSIVLFSDEIRRSKAIFLNGPMGMYEIEEYSAGTREVFNAVAGSGAVTIAGGGHTLSALENLDLLPRITHASTGGGALISYLSGEKMPVIEALKESMEIFGVKKDGRRDD